LCNNITTFSSTTAGELIITIITTFSSTTAGELIKNGHAHLFLGDFHLDFYSDFEEQRDDPPKTTPQKRRTGAYFYKDFNY